MKKFLAIIILYSCLIFPSKANDIKDFELDVISLGDSALKYFTKMTLKTHLKSSFIKIKLSSIIF